MIQFKFDGWDGPELRVFVSRSPGLAADRPVVFVMHGMRRNADDYRNQWHELALEHDVDLGLSGIVTGPVQPGTVQLTPSGRLIALMRDAQTTGGYARVLQFPEKSINSLAQLRPGARFQLIQG